MSEGTGWQDYGSDASLGASDTLLVRDVSATPPSAGTVKQVTAGALAAAMIALTGAQHVYDVVIAPSDSSAAFQACADVVLTGTADQTAINTAVAAMSSAGRVLIGPGSLSITGPIIFDQDYSELHGCGWATYIQAAESFSGAALINAGSASVLDGVTIQDIQLDGNYGTATGTTVGLLVSAAEVRMSRVEVKNATGAGYYFQAYDGETGIDEIDVRDCYAFTCAGYGMHVGTTVENSEFHRVFAVGNYGQGGTVYGSDGIYVEGNNCKFLQCHPYFCNGNGLTIAAGCGNHRIIDGEYETNNGSGIYLNDGFYRVAIIGPVFYANEGKFLAAAGDSDATELIVSGCSFFDVTSSSTDKVCYIGGVSGVSVIGNTFSLSGASSAVAALSLEEVDGGLVAGNVFTLDTSSQYSVYLNTATKCSVQGNYLDYQVYEDTGCDYNTYAHNRWRDVGTTPFTLVGANSVAADNLPVPDRRASPSAVTVTANGQTITAPPGGYLPLTATTARTGLILTAGAYNGQQVTLVNQGSVALTWATSATSHVSGNGTTNSMAAATGAIYVWDANTSLWYRVGTGT